MSKHKPNVLPTMTYDCFQEFIDAGLTHRQNNLEMYNDVELHQQSRKVLAETQQEQLESKYSGYDLDRTIESVEAQGSQTVLILSGLDELTVEQIQTKIKETVEKLDKESTGE